MDTKIYLHQKWLNDNSISFPRETSKPTAKNVLFEASKTDAEGGIAA